VDAIGPQIAQSSFAALAPASLPWAISLSVQPTGLCMVLIVAVALCALLLADIGLHIPFRRLMWCVRHFPVLGRSSDSLRRTKLICFAVDEASIWYFKRVECLQRSVVAVFLLRLYGVPADLVIGYRQLPFESHAWVEVDGMIVNDRPQYCRLFTPIERLSSAVYTKNEAATPSA